nr:sce7726 family protein [uncultured Campylobacter sp.]
MVDYEYDICEKFSYWLLKKYKNINLMASGIPFLKAKRIADLILLNGDNLIAYEIKTARDDLRRIDGQITDYLLTFDYFYLILDKKFQKEIARFEDKRIGIILHNCGKFTLIKKPIKNKPSSFCRALLISRSSAQKLAKNKKNVFEMYNFISKNFSQKEIKKKLIEDLKEAYLECFETFKNERDFFLLKNRFCLKELA